jgi:hypothetical protein
MDKHPDSNHPEPRQFSFWKPEPLPPKDSTILPVELISLGRLNEVAEHLLEVPKMMRVIDVPWDGPAAAPTLTLRWEVEQGVILQVKPEQGPPKPGEVLTINAKSSAPKKTFFKLYVQIFEQFGATLLDESSHQFFTPKEFRERMAG